MPLAICDQDNAPSLATPKAQPREGTDVHLYNGLWLTTMRQSDFVSSNCATAHCI